MKKTIVILCSLLAFAHSAQAGLHWWFSDGDLGPLGDSELVEVAGKGAPTGAMVAIYKATEARTDDGTWYKNLVVQDDFSIAGKGDTLVHESLLRSDGGWRYFDEDVTLEGGFHYYTVLFDRPSASVAAGTESIVLDKLTFHATSSDAWFEVFAEGGNAGIQWNTIQVAAPPAPYFTDISLTGGDVHLVWEGGEATTNHVEIGEDLVDTNQAWKILYTALPSMPAVTNFVHTAPTNSASIYRLRSEP